MTFQSTPQSDIKARPDRVRFLAEMPIEKFRAIESDLSRVPDWDRFFIMNNPPSWPDGMYDVLSRHLKDQLHLA